MAAVWWLLDGRYSFLPEFPQAYQLTRHSWWLNWWWLWHPFFFFFNWYGREYSTSHLWCLRNWRWCQMSLMWISEWRANYGSIEKQAGFRAVVFYWDDLPCSIPPALGPFGKCLETWSGRGASYLHLLVRGQACSWASHGAQGSPPKQRIIWSQISIERTLGWGTLKVTEWEYTALLAHFTYTGFSLWSQQFSLNYFQWVWFQLFQTEWNDFQLVHFWRVGGWFTIML